MSVLVLLVSALLVLWLVLNLLHFVRTFRAKAKSLFWVPGPSAFPILGNVQLFRLSRTELFDFKRDCFKKYGPIFKLWISNEPKVFVRGAEMLKLLLTDNVNIKKGDMYLEGLMSLGPGLINSYGDRWFQMRKMLTPSFHLERLETLPSEIMPQVKYLISNLDQHADTGVPFRAIEIFQCFGLDVALSTFLGFDQDTINETKHLQKSYAHAVEVSTQAAILKSFSPLGRFKLLFRLSRMYKPFMIAMTTVASFVKRLMEQRKDLDEKVDPSITNKPKMMFYDTLVMNLKKGLIPKEILFEELNQIVFAAFDTTATTLEFALFHLANNPEIQERLREEVDEFAGKALLEGLKIKELNSLEYLDRVLKESLRLTPAGDLITRRLVAPLTTSRGVIPAGTEVVMDLFNTHYIPQVWPQPEHFDPDRFLPDLTASRDPFDYVPFSAGARNCIGSKVATIELKIAIIAILSKFKVETTKTYSDMRFYSSQVIRCEDGLQLKLFRRNTRKD